MIPGTGTAALHLMPRRKGDIDNPQGGVRGVIPSKRTYVRTTKALLAGDGDKVADIFRERVMYRGAGALQWGWGVAYDKQGVKG